MSDRRAGHGYSAIRELLGAQFGILGAGPPPARPIAPMTLADRLELIADTAADLEVSTEANGDLLAAIHDTSGDLLEVLRDIRGTLEDMRDTLNTIAEQGAKDDG